MLRRQLAWVLLFAVLGGQGCSVDYPQNRIVCKGDDDCPDGMRCQSTNNRCASAPTPAVGEKKNPSEDMLAAGAGSMNKPEAGAGAQAGTGGVAGSAGGKAGSGGATGAHSTQSCDVDNGGCDSRVRCSQHQDGVTCGECPSGYRDAHGDGTECREIDECAMKTVDCGWTAACMNTPPGSYTCKDCGPGARGRDGSCVPLTSKQFGSTGDDFGSIAVGPDGAVYVTGVAGGVFDGSTSNGDADAFIAKYDSSLKLLWLRQFGTSQYDEAPGIAVDALGNAFVTGSTDGDLDQIKNAGGADGFVMKFNADGQRQWTDLFGSSGDDSANAIVLDPTGDAFVVGLAGGPIDGHSHKGKLDLILLKYSATGKRQVLQEWGTTEDDGALDVALANDGLYISGSTSGSLDGLANAGGQDAVLMKFDRSGSPLWTRQFGSAKDDDARSVALDGGNNVYVYGNTNSDDTGSDVLLAKYDNTGAKQWARTLATPTTDSAGAVATDAHGAVFVVGYTYGKFGATYYGQMDAFVAEYDGNGSQRWIRQIADKSDEEFSDIALDATGDLWLLGETNNTIDEKNKSAGGIDIFIVRYNSDGNRL